MEWGGIMGVLSSVQSFLNNYSLIIMSVVGGLVGSHFLFKEIKKRGIGETTIGIGIVISLVAGVISSRLIYVVLYEPSYYFSYLSEIIYFQDGGFSFFGGLLTSLLVGYIYLKKRGLPPWETLDIIAPFFILALGISTIGSDIHGAAIASDSLWTLKIDQETFHPSQAYEFLLSYLLFGYLWLRLKSKAYHGQVILNFLVGLFFIKAVVQFSLDIPRDFVLLSTKQMLLAGGILLSMIFIKYRQKKSTKIKQKNVERYEIAKTWFYIWALMFLSLIAYYLIQN